jgi:predicted PurR-regulated permease PerM
VQVIPAFSPQIIFRTLFITVVFVISLYLIYLLRKPIGWVLIAAFLAVALSGPVNVLNEHMRRGFAITIVYFCLLLVPIGIGALIIPPLVTQGNNLIQNLPEYAQDAQDFANRNERLRKVEEDYNITEKLQEQAEKLPARVGDAANVLGDIGLGLVNSLFSLFTILVLTAFLLGSGRNWVNRFLELRPTEQRERMRKALDHMGKAVGAYVGGVLAQATLAAILAYIVLAILGVPFAAALAIVIFFADLVPLVGATIGAVLVGVVTVFGDFPTATIIWVIYSIAYQQLENTVIQPQIQKRAVNVHPFIVLVAVLFGSTLLGVLGALVAIPVAASVQIAIREWWDYRHDRQVHDLVAPGTPMPPPSDAPAAPAP